MVPGLDLQSPSQQDDQLTGISTLCMDDPKSDESVLGPKEMLDQVNPNKSQSECHSLFPGAADEA